MGEDPKRGDCTRDEHGITECRKKGGDGHDKLVSKPAKGRLPHHRNISRYEWGGVTRGNHSSSRGGGNLRAGRVPLRD